MDALKEQLRKPLVLGIAALVLGFLLGLLYAYQIDPVVWTNAPIDLLRDDLKTEYLRMAIDSYALNPDPLSARARFEALGEDGPALLDALTKNPGGQNTQLILAYQVTVLGGSVLATTTPAAGEAPPVGAEQPAQQGGNFLTTALGVLCLVFLLVAGGAFYLFIYRNRKSGAPGAMPSTPVAQVPAREGWTDYAAAGQEPPMVQFMSSYKIGDDLFDESFSIDSPVGEFLGECGVGISETVGVGEPKKVTAFEVWLFDKNDIQTVTKVVMSAHAFLDEASRQRLAAKGEPILAEPGIETILETQTLRLTARIIDLGYGEGAVPDHSFFERMILELSVWSKV
jgi:hypothetical protein